MAKTSEKTKKKAGIALPKFKTEREVISLTKIVSNVAQSRGMGVMPVLQDEGYGLFESLEEGKDSIWSMLQSEKPEDKKLACDLIQEKEGEVWSFAQKLREMGQLQPPGVWETSEGFDAIFGMRRLLAQMVNFALGKTDGKVEVQVLEFEKDPSLSQLRLLALGENDDRKGEGPIDRALTFKAMMDDDGCSPQDIAAAMKASDQYVRNYLKLLDKKLEDKREAINSGRLKIDPALKLLAKRKTDAKAEPDRDSKNKNDERRKFRPIKWYESHYTQGYQPTGVSDKEWEFMQDESVRKFLAYTLGLKYTPYKEKAPPKTAKKGKGKGESTNGDGEEGYHKKIFKERAVRLLIALGKTSARTWDEGTIKERLENLPNIVEEENPKIEEDDLRRLYENLMSHYKEGLKIEIMPDKKK